MLVIIILESSHIIFQMHKHYANRCTMYFVLLETDKWYNLHLITQMFTWSLIVLEPSITQMFTQQYFKMKISCELDCNCNSWIINVLCLKGRIFEGCLENMKKNNFTIYSWNIQVFDIWVPHVFISLTKENI